MDQPVWLQEFQKEMEQAAAARKDGNEGRARVCVRRAVGAVIGEYYRRKGIDLSKMCAYDRLFYLIDQEGIPNDVQLIVEYFVMRVTPNRELPLPVDLIEKARWILATLLPDLPTK